MLELVITFLILAFVAWSDFGHKRRNRLVLIATIALALLWLLDGGFVELVGLPT